MLRIANHADLDNKHSDQGDALIKSLKAVGFSVSVKDSHSELSAD